MDSDLDLIPFNRAAETLISAGFRLSRSAIFEAAIDGRISIYAKPPEGSEVLEARPQKGGGFTLVLRQYKANEMVELTPQDCIQFLQTSEAHIYGEGILELQRIGLLDETDPAFIVRDVSMLFINAADMNGIFSIRKSA